MKKIPSKFSLLGLDIKVQQLPYDALQKKHRDLASNAGRNTDDIGNVLGLYDYSTSALYIVAKDLKRWSEDFRLSVFHHELAHGLLYMAGRGDLSSDETLVDVLGNLILQADKTAVYE